MASVYGQNAAMFKVPAGPRRIFIPEQLRSGEKAASHGRRTLCLL